MKKFIIGFFSVLLFLIVGLAVFVFTFDLNSYKSRIEKALTDLSGYNFVINGKIKATHSLEPIIVVSDVNIMASSDDNIRISLDGSVSDKDDKPLKQTMFKVV